jgi:hypothetical protein
MQEGMEDLSMQFFTYLRASLAVTVKRRPVKREYRPPYSRFTVPRASVQSSTRRRNIKTASLHGAHEFPFFFLLFLILLSYSSTSPSAQAREH